MGRVLWKGPYVNKNFINKKFEVNIKNKTKARNSEIIPNFLGQTFYIHNGKGFIKVVVTEEKVGHKFGEFSFTRQKFVFKNNNGTKN